MPLVSFVSFLLFCAFVLMCLGWVGALWRRFRVGVISRA